MGVLRHFHSCSEKGSLLFLFPGKCSAWEGVPQKGSEKGVFYGYFTGVKKGSEKGSQKSLVSEKGGFQKVPSNAPSCRVRQG